jgi:hypothetical protein
MHCSFVISGREAPMIPMSAIWGREQAFGQSEIETRNS